MSNNLRVKVISSPSTNEYGKYLLSMTPGSKGEFNGIKFYFNTDLEQYDYLVVLHRLDNKINIHLPREKTIFVAGEPSSIKTYNPRFLNQFGHVVTCQEKITHRSKIITPLVLAWFPKKSYDEIVSNQTIKKTKKLSIVVSNKSSTQGHRDRLAFCLKLKERLGDKVDLFGRGFNDFEDKWDVIAPYKYSIAIENSIEGYNITEKITDCFTSLTFPFYMGAPNIKNYYSEESFKLIDIYNFEESVKIIESIIDDENHYDRHLQYLLDSKNKYLAEYAIAPMLSKIIRQIDYRIESEEIYLKEWTLHKHRTPLLQVIKKELVKFLSKYRTIKF